MATDPDYLTNAKRLANRVAMTARLDRATKTFTKADLLAACETNNVPAGPVNDLGEVFADEQVISRGMQMELGGVPSVRSPFVFSDAELAHHRPSPKLGEHNDEILPDLGKKIIRE